MPELFLKYDPNFFDAKWPKRLPPLPDLLYAAFDAAVVDVALHVTDQIMPEIVNKSFTSLMYKNSPGLNGFNWSAYINNNK